MGKENTGKAGVLNEEVILTWVGDLLKENNLPASSALGLDEWICAGLVWVRVAPKSFQAFCQEQLQQSTQRQPIPSDLVLAGLFALLSEDEFSIFDQLANKHLLLAETLDPEETGLLQWPNTDTPYFPAVQAAWVWSSDQLLNWKLPSTQTEQLIQLKEIFVYETDRQLWNKTQKSYGELPTAPHTKARTPANTALAMLAWIPDQDRAEDLLNAYRNQAPPWQDQEVAAEEWLGAAAYLLYEALKAYEMSQAAQELRNYALRHLLNTAQNARQACLLWLWHNNDH